jgi:REP element-mobilizing transposase RayT
MPDDHSRDGVTSRLRLRGFDYSSAASYFVTICTEHRVCLFGDVRDGMLEASHAGVVMDSWWLSISWRFPSVMTDAFVVMPNHVHGILHVGTNPATRGASSLGDILHWYKTRTTFDYTIGVKTEGWPRFPGRLWQKGYYDHIIRSQRGLEEIRAYIDRNPAMWVDDDYNPRNMG